MTKRTPTPDHGHYLNYLRDGHRDPECTQAWADWCAQQKQERLAKGLKPRDRRHGTENGYTNWGCRCDRCTKAHNIGNAKRAKKGRAAA